MAKRVQPRSPKSSVLLSPAKQRLLAGRKPNEQPDRSSASSLELHRFKTLCNIMLFGASFREIFANAFWDTGTVLEELDRNIRARSS